MIFILIFIFNLYFVKAKNALLVELPTKLFVNQVGKHQVYNKANKYSKKIFKGDNTNSTLVYLEVQLTYFLVRCCYVG